MSKEEYFNMLKNCDYYDGKANVLKNRLERVMKTKCQDRKKINNKEYRNIFMDFRFRSYPV